MATKFKVGDWVMVPENAPGIVMSWWIGKPTIIRAVIEAEGLYEVLFGDEDAADFAFLEEDQIVFLNDSRPEYIEDLHATDL